MTGIAVSLVISSLVSSALSSAITCDLKCPPEDVYVLVCGFDARHATYTMFPSRCAFDRYQACGEHELTVTPIDFCIKNELKKNMRRYYREESCPVFCPQLYRPICAAARTKSYAYKTFTNGCHLDMLNCRGSEDEDEYIEVPLSFCPQHAMKNIFKDQIIMKK